MRFRFLSLMLIFVVFMWMCSTQDKEPSSTTNMEKGIVDEQSSEMASDSENIDLKLINAAANGDIDVVKKLINAGADLTARDDSDRTALMWAALRNYPDVIKPLLEAGADINASEDSGYSGLMAASKYGQKEAVETLIEAGVDVNAKHRDGYTALWMAAIWGNSQIASMLVKAGSEVDAPQDSKGQTALMGAAMNGKVDTVKALLDAGANVIIKDDFGKTALDHAEEKGVNEEVIRILREAEERN